MMFGTTNIKFFDSIFLYACIIYFYTQNARLFCLRYLTMLSTFEVIDHRTINSEALE